MSEYNPCYCFAWPRRNARSRSVWLDWHIVCAA